MAVNSTDLGLDEPMRRVDRSVSSGSELWHFSGVPRAGIKTLVQQQLQLVDADNLGKGKARPPMCPDGETGRRSGLKIRRPQGRGGSIPPPGTK